jgi:hypothetical protein
MKTKQIGGSNLGSKPAISQKAIKWQHKQRLPIKKNVLKNVSAVLIINYHMYITCSYPDISFHEIQI